MRRSVLRGHWSSWSVAASEAMETLATVLAMVLEMVLEMVLGCWLLVMVLEQQWGVRMG